MVLRNVPLPHYGDPPLVNIINDLEYPMVIEPIDIEHVDHPITIHFKDPNGEIVNIDIPFPNLNIARVDVAAKNVIHDFIQDNYGLYPELARNLTEDVINRSGFNRIDDRNYNLVSPVVLIERGNNKRELDDGDEHHQAHKRRKGGGSKLKKSKLKKRRKSKRKKRRKSKTKRR